MHAIYTVCAVSSTPHDALIRRHQMLCQKHGMVANALLVVVVYLQALVSIAFSFEAAQRTYIIIR